MFAPGQRVGVAVSGGADSVALLHVLVELAPGFEIWIEVLHLDHGLRGEQARADAGFVAEMARRLGLPFHLETAGLRGAPGNLEEAAREARLAFFRRFLASGALDRVALGHTRSDQAETVLFRFLRGAGTAGLAGIRPVTSEGLVRPFLDLERWEVEAWLRQRGIAWREDSTNQSREFARNRIRHDLLPQLASEWNPALIDTLAQTAAWAQDEEAYWEQETARLAAAQLGRRGDAILIETGALRRLPAAAARRLLRHAMAGVKGDLRSISFAHVEAILELARAAKGHGRAQAPGVDVTRSFDWLRLAPPGTGAPRGYRMPLGVPARTALPEDAVIETELVGAGTESGPLASVYNGSVDVLDWRRVAGPLEVRNWRPGDEYQRVGSHGEERIKFLFQEHRIPVWERRHWPVVTRGETIVWVGRFGAAAGVAAAPGAGELLRIRYVPAPVRRSSEF
jgi:tRNA(Ile)-lysidine synthase